MTTMTALHYLGAMEFPSVTTTAILFLASALLALLYAYPYRALTAPHRNLPGPESSSVFIGALPALLSSRNTLRDWMAAYGGAIRFRSFFGQYELAISDLKAVQHILTNAESFVKPLRFRKAFSTVMGRGVMFEEFEFHKKLRRGLSPSFGAPATRDFAPIILDKSYELRDKFAALLDDGGSEVGVDLNVRRIITNSNLDIAGMFTFNRDFGILGDEGSPVLNGMGPAALSLLASQDNLGASAALIPGLRFFVGQHLLLTPA